MKIESFEMVVLNRSKINMADYNPREITEKAKQKLKRSLKKFGLVQPLVFNKQTGNLVGGHQRLEIMDDINKTQDYNINCAVIDVDLETEKKLNIYLNNTSAMGEFNPDALKDLVLTIPNCDITMDLGFDRFDFDITFMGNNQAIEVFGEDEHITATEDQIEKMRAVKKEQRAVAKEMLRQEDAYNSDVTKSNDIIVSFVFNTNGEKKKFLEDHNLNATEKYFKSDILIELTSDK
jgi:hypothetical protein